MYYNNGKLGWVITFKDVTPESVESIVVFKGGHRGNKSPICCMCGVLQTKEAAECWVGGERYIMLCFACLQRIDPSFDLDTFQFAYITDHKSPTYVGDRVDLRPALNPLEYEKCERINEDDT